MIFRRAKNSNPGSMAKNASPADYKYATGLEAVIGYLYLTDQKERLDYVLQRIVITETAIEKGEIDVHGSKE
jgi:ribonuclease-3 family protein